MGRGPAEKSAINPCTARTPPRNRAHNKRVRRGRHLANPAASYLCRAEPTNRLPNTGASQSPIRRPTQPPILFRRLLPCRRPILQTSLLYRVSKSLRRKHSSTSRTISLCSKTWTTRQPSFTQDHVSQFLRRPQDCRWSRAYLHSSERKVECHSANGRRDEGQRNSQSAKKITKPTRKLFSLTSYVKARWPVKSFFKKALKIKKDDNTNSERKELMDKFLDMCLTMRCDCINVLVYMYVSGMCLYEKLRRMDRI